MLNILDSIRNYLSTATIVMLPASNEKAFMAEVAKFQRKAVKMGCEPITVAAVGDAFDTVMNRSILELDRFGEKQERYIKVPVTMKGFSIVGGMPKLSGFKLLGVLEFDVNGVIVREVPGCTIPEAYRATNNRCDHCNKARARNEVVVVEEMATGRTIQVGKACCKDYLGHNINALYAGLEFMSFIDTVGSDTDTYGGSRLDYVATVTYLAAVSAALRDSKDVYMPSREGQCGTRVVADMVYGLVRAPQDFKLCAEDCDYERAKNWISEATALFDAKETLTSFEHNLKLAVSYEGFSVSLSGVVAALPMYLGKSAERKAVDKAETQSTYQGVVGKRQEFALTLAFRTSFESVYGTTYVYKFTDASGNIYVWKTGGGLVKSDGFYLGTGDTVVVKATVKEHSEYKGVRQTVLTRVSLVREMNQAAA